MGKSFTVNYESLVKRLTSKAIVVKKYEDRTEQKDYLAIWDTGAVQTVITPKVVSDFQLPKAGDMKIISATGTAPVNCYFIDLALPNDKIIADLPVVCSDLMDDADILIGMDVIVHGDFAVTNLNGKTSFSFRIPSEEKIDFPNE